MTAGGLNCSDGLLTCFDCAEAIALFGELLTSFEKKEIQEYPDSVYFVGAPGINKINALADGPNNGGTQRATLVFVSKHARVGYDNEDGFYNIILHDHIEYRYEVLSLLGRGSFSQVSWLLVVPSQQSNSPFLQVVQVLDHKTHDVRALKIIRNRKRFHQQAVVELLNHVHIMQHVCVRLCVCLLLK